MTVIDQVNVTDSDDARVRPRQLLRIATAGSVDDGKSTLIGRLLHDTDSLPLDHLDSVTDEHGVADLAALSDGLRAEREQGITIDVAYRFFSTPTRNYILADTPGHERYTRNMFTGASNANVAVLLVDARAGVLRQTRRHARIATLVGVNRLVAAVNKIDLVDYDETRFREVEAELTELGSRLGVEILVVPVAAKIGDNVVSRSERTPWYTGPTLLEYLESIELTAPAPSSAQLRLPLQWVSRPTESRPASGLPGGERRRYTGRLSAGTLEVGDEIMVLPSGSRSVVTALDTLDDTRTVAVAPLSVSVELADDIDVARGDVLVSGRPDAVLPTTAREIDATVCWLAEEPLKPGDRVALKHTSSTVRATVHRIHSRLDPETLDEHGAPAALALNDIARVTLRTSSIIVTDNYADNRDAGAFVLIDEHTNDTVGAGIVLSSRVAADRTGAENVEWHETALPRAERVTRTGQRGATVWLTGPASDRKDEVAHAIEDRLTAAGRSAYVLSGDNVTHTLFDDLDSSGERGEHADRLGRLARLFADAGTVTITPLSTATRAARAVVEAAELPFVEVEVIETADADSLAQQIVEGL